MTKYGRRVKLDFMKAEIAIVEQAVTAAELEAQLHEINAAEAEFERTSQQRHREFMEEKGKRLGLMRQQIKSDKIWGQTLKRLGYGRDAAADWIAYAKALPLWRSTRDNVPGNFRPSTIEIGIRGVEESSPINIAALASMEPEARQTCLKELLSEVTPEIAAEIREALPPRREEAKTVPVDEITAQQKIEKKFKETMADQKAVIDGYSSLSGMVSHDDVSLSGNHLAQVTTLISITQFAMLNLLNIVREKVQRNEATERSSEIIHERLLGAGSQEDFEQEGSSHIRSAGEEYAEFTDDI